MEVVAILLCIYIVIYSFYIIRLCNGFTKVKRFVPMNSELQTTFSVIIPFRSEERNLPRFLAAISKLNYPLKKFELIFVDDASEDFSVNVVNKWRMANGLFHTTLIDNVRVSNSPKKDAITRAVAIATNDWVITTDADAFVGADWLKTFNDYIIRYSPKMIAGPVAYDGPNTFLSHFQTMDLLSLQGATIGSFGNDNAFMCNGANLAYQKQLFIDISGFEGNNSLASGDDVFLLQKAHKRNPSAVHYLKAREAMVRTRPAANWFQLFNQRVRWASKASAYESSYGANLSLAVFFGNLALVLALGFTLSGLLSWKFFLALALAKAIPDLILLAQANVFFRSGKFFFPLISMIIYPFFGVAIAFRSFTGKYQWKGRKYK